MKLIIVTGMPGSGKEEFLNVAAGMGIPFVRMGDVVRDFHSAHGGGIGVGEYAGRERVEHGYDIWAKRSMERMHSPMILVDGCRSMDEIRAFVGLAEDVRIVAIHTSPRIRYGRLVQRGRDDAPSDYDEFAERDEREIGWGIAKAIVLSDVMIVNDGTLEGFRRESERVLEMLR